MANDIDKTSPHYKGEFGSIYEVNQKFPNGGVAGDYVEIDGWAHYWNADRGTWCVNAQRDSYWDELITGIINKLKLFKGATYMGVAGVSTVPEKIAGVKMYYFANAAGTYSGFDGLQLAQGINVLYTDNGTSWTATPLLEVAQELGVSTEKVMSQKAVNTELGKKADKAAMDVELGKKADKEAMDVELGKKADKADMDVELGKKADKETVNASLDLKANKSDVAKTNAAQDAEISRKANQQDVERSLHILRQEIGERTVVEGNVNNNPDEEDLTSKMGPNNREVLSLKDREYNPLEFSGKGYKILRKNLQEVTCAITKIQVTKVPTVDGYVSIIINGMETHVDLVASTDNTVALVAKKIADKLSKTMDEYVTSVDGALVTCTRRFGGDVTSSSFSGVSTGSEATVSESSKTELRNLITAVMLNQSNCIYEIRYDFDLDGKTLEVPENCTLKFEGGSLNNGTIKFISMIDIVGKKGIKDNLNITSNINNQIINADIFETTDLSIILTALNDIRQRKLYSKVESTLFVTLQLSNNIYYINNDTDISNVKIIGLGQYTTAIYLKNGRCYSTSAKCLWCEKLTIILDKTNTIESAIHIFARSEGEVISRGVCYLSDINFLCLENSNLRDFQSPTTFGEQNNTKAFYCDASKGFYPLTIKNINILRYRYGIYIDGKDTGWITIGRLENIYINKTHIGIYLQKVTGISLTNVAIDCDEEYVDTDNYANYCIYLKKVHTCTIINLETFNDSGDKKKKVYPIYSINCTNINVNGSIEGQLYDNKDFMGYNIIAMFHSLFSPGFIGESFLRIEQSKKASPIDFTNINLSINNCVTTIDNNLYFKIKYGAPLILKFKHKATLSGFYIMFKHKSNCDSFDSTPIAGATIADVNTKKYADIQYNNKEEEFFYLYIAHNESNEYSVQINTLKKDFINYINIESLRIVDNGISFAALNCNRISLYNSIKTDAFNELVKNIFKDDAINFIECCLDSYTLPKIIIAKYNTYYKLVYNNFELKGTLGDILYIMSSLKVTISDIKLFTEQYENYSTNLKPSKYVEILNNCVSLDGVKYVMCTTDKPIYSSCTNINNKNISILNTDILPIDTNLDLIGYNIPTIASGTNRGFMFFDSNKNQIKVWDGERWVKQSVLNDDFIVDSAHRPTNPQTGCQIYDLNLKKPIWWTGKKWVDATGADV